MKNRDTIIEKIKKLLRLAGSSNEHEAALAAARAQELLAKYNLNETDFSDYEPPIEAGVVSVKTVKKPAPWVHLLAAAVAGAFDCRYFHRPYVGEVCFVGVDLDHEVASYTFGYVYRSINRLAGAFMGKSQQRRLVTAKGRRKVRRSYCLGCTNVIRERLEDQKMRTPITTMALVPVKEALIKAKLVEFNINTKDLDEEDLSTRAFWAGRKDGATIDHGRRAIREKKSGPLRIGFYQ